MAESVKGRRDRRRAVGLADHRTYTAWKQLSAFTGRGWRVPIRAMWPQPVFEQQESNIFLNLISFGAIRVRDITTPRVVVKKFQRDMRICAKWSGTSGPNASVNPVPNSPDRRLSLPKQARTSIRMTDKPGLLRILE